MTGTMSTSTYSLRHSSHVPDNIRIAPAETLILCIAFPAESLQVFEKPRACLRTGENPQHAGLGDLEPAPRVKRLQNATMAVNDEDNTGC